jgi:glycosyltransferase involved in cell wall biosynthesis
MTRVLLATSFGHGGPRAWALAMARRMAPEVQVRLADSLPRMRRLLAGPRDIVQTTIPFVRSRRPLIATLKGDYTQESRLYRGGYRRLLRRADAVTVPSRYLRDALRLDDAFVIPNAVDPPSQRWRPRPAGKAMPPGTLRALVASNFSFPAKTQGTLELVEALGPLAAARGWQVDVAGQGRLEGHVREAVRRAGPTLRFVGWLDLPARLVDYDVLLYRSHLDNQPNLLIEAMSAGVPLLANSVGDVPAMVPPPCILDDLGELGPRLDAFAAGDEGVRLSRLELAAVPRFHWDTVKPAWLQLYRGLA